MDFAHHTAPTQRFTFTHMHMVTASTFEHSNKNSNKRFAQLSGVNFVSFVTNIILFFLVFAHLVRLNKQLDVMTSVFHCFRGFHKTNS